MGYSAGEMVMMEIQEELNQEQIEAVRHREGPLLVLAGAGSGKTRVVTYRIAYLIESGVPPSQILAVTFTNKAAGEMQGRIEKTLSGFEGYPTICTFHSLGVRILRESISHLGYFSHFLIYDEDDSNKLLRGCIESLGLKKEGSQVKVLRSLISQAKNNLQDPSEIVLRDLPYPLQQSFPALYTTYQERLKEANALDFDDLLFLTVKLFKEHPEVLATYQERWPYLLIDEYQDTNHVQYLLAKMLVAKRGNIFVVGDPDQSIYSWRGANIENILNFERDYPGAKVIRLEQNYRSCENILEAANALIKTNQSRFEKNLWSARGEGEKITLFVGETDRQEAGFVTQEIERLHTFSQVPYKEMSIFYRTNFQSRVFEDFLLRKRIPYVIVGGISFYQRREIKDLLAFLRMVISDQDAVSFERTLNLPKRGIGLVTVEKIRTAARERGLSIFAFCQQILKEEKSELRLTKKQREGLSEYVTLIENLRKEAETSPLDRVIREAYQQSRYAEVLQEDKETLEDRKANIEELISKGHEWEIYHDTGSLAAFLEELTLKSSIDEASLSDDQVHLMTIHNGKGLEFHAAFLVGMEEDLFPHANSRNNYDSLEEERRLCYVGMTRAKDRLYLSAAETRYLWGSQRMMRPSRFLREIPRKYITKRYV
ncbi:MAG: ATP-dependent DNA helicase PcrA [Chlamydiae bacterium]|nr:ATP-dependent DNA helicase PcrA [Chlamydiota bacterium]